MSQVGLRLLLTWSRLFVPPGLSYKAAIPPALRANYLALFAQLIIGASQVKPCYIFLRSPLLQPAEAGETKQRSLLLHNNKRKTLNLILTEFIHGWSDLLFGVESQESVCNGSPLFRWQKYPERGERGGTINRNHTQKLWKKRCTGPWLRAPAGVGQESKQDRAQGGQPWIGTFGSQQAMNWNILKP